MSRAPKNQFKARLRAGETQWGLWSTLNSPVAAEALSLTGFDWMLFDTEHKGLTGVMVDKRKRAIRCMGQETPREIK